MHRPFRPAVTQGDPTIVYTGNVKRMLADLDQKRQQHVSKALTTDTKDVYGGWNQTTPSSKR